MTKRQIERRLKALGMRLEKDGRHWLARPDTVGSCYYGQVIELKSLAEAAVLVDMREIAAQFREGVA